MHPTEPNTTVLQFIESDDLQVLQKENESLRTITFITCIAVITFGAIGNGLVVLILGTRKPKLKSFEYFMISLAVSDFLNAVVVPTQNILELINFDFRKIGLCGCKFISFISFTSLTVTALTLVTVSVDRFWAIRWPLRKRLHQKRIVIVAILSTWVAASVFGSIYFVGNNVCLNSVNNNTVYECYTCMKQSEFSIFVLSGFTVQTGIPIVLMTVLYVLIVIELRNKSKMKRFVSDKQEMKLRLIQNTKSTKMVVTVVVIFYICFLPINLFYLWYMFHKHKHLIQEIKIIFDILTLLQMCTSVANPIIYSRLHTTFKREIIKLICPCCYDKSRKSFWIRISSIISTEKTLTRNETSERRSLQTF
ncbi:RYamide receptor [Hydra vulgaris]|uniref:RYamide receptor n=1 Tax=Hydra vulgaris TaxID=6087 RepID=UPI001F5F200C|nr:RYamide receptor [Hydra vulgaris]